MTWHQVSKPPLSLSGQPTFLAFQPRGIMRSPHLTQVRCRRSFARFCNLAFPAEHITIRASKVSATLFLQKYLNFFVDIFDI